MQRVRQFGQLRQSRQTQKGSLSAQKQPRFESVKHSLICVNCVNKSLSKQKQLKEKIKKQSQFQSALKDIDREAQANPLQQRNRRKEESYRMMTQYNTEVARLHSEQKDRQKAKKLEQKKQQETQREKLLKDSQARAKRQRLLKQKWSSDLKQQMVEKQVQRLKQTAASSAEKQNFFRDSARVKGNETSCSYREELKQQMQLNQLKREAMREQQKKGMSTNLLLDWAQERQRKLKQQEHDKKKLLLEQTKLKETQLYEKRQQKQHSDALTRQQLADRHKAEDERRQLIARMRENRMTDYIREVKQQIQLRDQQKRSEKQAKLLRFQQTFPAGQRTKETLACSSCEKTYPKSYLSEFH